MHNKENMLFTFTIFPLGSGDDVSGPVAEVVSAIQKSGLTHQVTGSCTLIEGVWKDVMPVIEKSIHDLTEKHPRVYAVLTVDHHEGRSDRLKSSIEKVEKVLDGPVQSTP